ncbi:MAG: DUF2934 domain-containing protein, partial [Burkholderiales bacterium]|nr:DUF2934 domain-containing protein [Burkholderiales bacterium]
MKHHSSETGTPRPVHGKSAARAKTAVAKAVTGSRADAGENHERLVRETAYAFYEARGRLDGHDLEDWLRAEGQVARALGE